MNEKEEVIPGTIVTFERATKNTTFLIDLNDPNGIEIKVKEGDEGMPTKSDGPARFVRIERTVPNNCLTIG